MIIPLVFFYRLAGLTFTFHLVLVGMSLSQYLRGNVIDQTEFFRITTMTVLPVPIALFRESAWLMQRIGRWTFFALYLFLIFWIPDLWASKDPVFRDVRLWGTVSIVLNVSLLLVVTWRISKDGSQTKRRA